VSVASRRDIATKVATAILDFIGDVPNTATEPSSAPDAAARSVASAAAAKAAAAAGTLALPVGPIGWLTQPPSDMTSVTPMAAVLALIPQPLFNFDTAHGSFLIWSAPFKYSRVCHSRAASTDAAIRRCGIWRLVLMDPAWTAVHGTMTPYIPISTTPTSEALGG